MWSQIYLVTLNTSHKISTTKDIACHQVEIVVALKSDLHPFFIQLTSNFYVIIIYDKICNSICLCGMII
jgi:hypothetical protein